MRRQDKKSLSLCVFVDHLNKTLFLLTRLPPQGHLLISSRRESPLALARLRARGELVTLSAADLRFSQTEIAAFFAHTLGMQLTTEAVAALDQRTEGWAAGLRLL